MLKDIALLLMAAATLPGCMSSNAVEKEAKKVSKPLSFTVKSLDGKEVDLNKYQGKVVMSFCCGKDFGLAAG